MNLIYKLKYTMDKENENNKSEDIITCRICFNLLYDLKICNICNNSICLNCFESIDKCAYCRNNKNNFIKPPHILNDLLNIYKEQCLYCKKNIFKEEYLEHLEKCGDENIECNFLNIGCGIIYKKKIQEEHIKNCLIYNNEKIFRKIGKEIIELRRENEKLEEKNNEINNMVNYLTNEVNGLTLNINKLVNSVHKSVYKKIIKNENIEIILKGISKPKLETLAKEYKVYTKEKLKDEIIKDIILSINNNYDSIYRFLDKEGYINYKKYVKISQA